MENLSLITVTRLPHPEGSNPTYQLLGYINGKCVLNATGDKQEIADQIFEIMTKGVL